MKAALSNVGHRRALSLRSAEGLDLGLTRLRGEILEPWIDSKEQRELLLRSYIELWPDSTEKDFIELRLRRNPLEHVRKAYFEFTTRCNLSCAHCYNAGVERRTETNLGALAEAADTLCDMGLREFAFIGGEVAKYGEGWLELAQRLRSRGAEIISILSSGWFLGQRDFDAAGRRYPDEAAYLADLREHGVSHVCFSIDDRGEAHDGSRGVPGLYDRVLAGFATVREAGMLPRVSCLAREGDDTLAHLLELSRLLYGDGPSAGTIWEDNTNIISNFIDIGNGARSAGSACFQISDLPREAMRCKAFFRPSPHITLKANGELSTCRLANAGEGYGNFHKMSPAEVLNRMQDSIVYRLHAENRIGEYLRFVDESIFGTIFIHPCSLRAVVTMIARRMHEQGVEADDIDGIARINREVARTTGYMKTMSAGAENWNIQLS
jgi:hypothetical protein